MVGYFCQIVHPYNPGHFVGFSYWIFFFPRSWPHNLIKFNEIKITFYLLWQVMTRSEMLFFSGNFHFFLF